MNRKITLEPPLGIFGGTFDPLHNGHIYPIIEAAKLAHIHKIAMMPCFIPTHKQSAHVASKHRLNMVKLVCEQYPIFYPDPRDIQRNTPTYSVDSLASFRKEMPNTPLCFFIGSDSLVNLFTWHKWQTILTLCHFIVCNRHNEKTDGADELTSQDDFSVELQTLLKKRQVTDPSQLRSKLAGYIYLAPSKPYTISSTKLRQRLIEHQNNVQDIPTAVLHYIQQHKLYQPE